MKRILPFISFVGLAFTIFPSLLVFAKLIESDLNKILMMIGTLLWFSSAPFWSRKKNAEGEN